MARKMQQEWSEDMLDEEKRQVLEGQADQLLGKQTSLVSTMLPSSFPWPVIFLVGSARLSMPPLMVASA